MMTNRGGGTSDVGCRTLPHCGRYLVIGTSEIVIVALIVGIITFVIIVVLN